MASSLPPVDPSHVFINCPFDKRYKPLFDAIVFTVHQLGFQARHALIGNGNVMRSSANCCGAPPASSASPWRN